MCRFPSIKFYKNLYLATCHYYWIAVASGSDIVSLEYTGT